MDLFRANGTGRWFHALTVMVVAATIGVAGCSEDDDPASDSATPTSSKASIIDSSSDPSSDPSGVITVAAKPTDPPQTGPVDEQPVPTAKPVPLDSPAAFSTDEPDKAMVASVVKIEGVEVTDVQPGDVGGPAVAFTVRFENKTGDKLELGNTAVTAAYKSGGQEQEASAMVSPPAKPVEGEVATGESAEGVYLFRIPPSDRKDVTLRVSYSSTSGQVLFAGAIK